MAVNQNKPKRTLGKRIKDGLSDFAYAFRDLKSQKAKTYFAINGIVISILLMQIVGVLTDSLSFSYLDSAATSSGASDFMITANFDNLDPYIDQSYVQQTLDGIEKLENSYPRLLLFPLADIVNPLPSESDNRTVKFYGLNLVEEDDGGLGRFKYIENETTFAEAIPDDYCIISPYIQDALHVDVGDNVTIRYATFPVRNYTVMAVVEPEQKFTSLEIDTIVISLDQIQTHYGLEGKVNYFNVVVKNRGMIYDTRNIPKTIEKMRDIAETIQIALGEDYSVQMLKLTELESSETMNVAMSVAFIFISIISMMIAAILINSILSTAVEERIREFGIFRVLGARKSFSFKMILSQGLVFSTVGSSIGVVLINRINENVMENISTVLVFLRRYLYSDVLTIGVVFLLNKRNTPQISFCNTGTNPRETKVNPIRKASCTPRKAIMTTNISPEAAICGIK